MGKLWGMSSRAGRWSGRGGLEGVQRDCLVEQDFYWLPPRCFFDVSTTHTLCYQKPVTLSHPFAKFATPRQSGRKFDSDGIYTGASFLYTLLCPL